MDTRPVTPATLASSVIAVPPVARTASFAWHHAENARLIRHLEAGGIRTLLYGGNAVLNHVAPSEYAGLLAMLSESVAKDTLVVPSVGPSFGMLMDQAEILRDFAFPTAMLLPTNDVTTPAGIALALRRFVDRFQRPAVLYLKHDGTLEIDTIQRLMNDGMLSWIKYAIVRKNTAEDPFLRGLIDAIGPSRIVSGIGEQPAIVHLRDFGMAGFTSGCVCVAPRLSMDLLRAVQAGDFVTAERIRARFQPLEALRDTLSPVRVLHAAVQLAGIADTGPIVPLLSPIDAADRPAIEAAAKALMA
jgi:dihydrodipicolinate synthase/N-acetylneuraminate lyase